MLVEISRFYASHGDWSPRTGEFGLWGVMGADEFHMMVHNNAYTNTMAKKTFEWTLDAIAKLRRQDSVRWKALRERLGILDVELKDWRRMARKMRLHRDAETGFIEQHDGFFDLPQADFEAIAASGMSICKTHPYISRSRFNWIKQPDVILLHLFFSHDYTEAEKRVNFEYYEPKCAHESSLSPGVHSILATELGMHEMAFDYVRHASRMDLDDYNGNTDQGLHMTSMAAAWMSLVYGFGGMRSDGPRLSFAPSIPARWRSFEFRVEYRGALISVRVGRKSARLAKLEGPAVDLEVYGCRMRLGAKPIEVPIPEERVAASLRSGRGPRTSTR
jgi:maltose phosphorylase